MQRHRFKHYDQVPAPEWRWTAFTPKDLASPDDGSLVVDEPSLDCLQALAKRLGLGEEGKPPLTILAAHRSASHHAKHEDASRTSPHRQGRAFHIAVKGLRRAAIEEAALDIGFRGIGHYETFVHLDTGPARRWDARRPSRRKAATVPGATPDARPE